MKNFTLKSKQGFTLIETLFAVLLFTTSLVALMAVAGRGIASNTTAREDLVARYLALEGLEAVRNIRDTNYISTTNAWDLGLTGCPVSNPCDIEYPYPQAPNLQSNAGPLYVGLDGSYSMDASQGGIITPFYRSVIIEPIGNSADELKVVSRVQWQSKSVQRSVEYVDYLKKWR